MAKPPSPTIRLEVLREAVLDAFLLLSRGYPRRSVLNTVAGRRGLNDWEKLAVYHCIHPYNVVRRIRASTRCPLGGIYAIDGYNVAVSLACIEARIPLLLCPDGFVRDVMGGWKPGTEEAARLLAGFLGWLREALHAEPVVYLDSRVSKSGLLASTLRRMGFRAATSKTADKSVLEAARRRGYTPVTSDIVVLEAVGGCNIVTHYAIVRGARVIDIPRLLGEGFDSVRALWGLA